MRLDKLFTTVGLLSRKECAAAVRRGRITVNGAVAKAPDLAVDPEGDTVTLDGERVAYARHAYLWLNKPKGYVSATEDGRLPVVTELVPPEYARRGLFPCGRLDRDTEGLLLLTDDGPLTHALLSPKRGVRKVYRFTTEVPLPADAEERLLGGMMLGEVTCRPALLSPNADRLGGTVTLTEGKYHEVKRMMAALGAPLLSLERIAFADIPLDPTLPRGACRPLTDGELAHLKRAALSADNN
ncbi:MAG: rRNA pseudouridine synthase [Clostridia bacterium]|nr:rRNA pseudouridine synthase [Clostridia bacterium]